MKYINHITALFLMLFVITACEKTEYSLGDLTAPSNLVINAEIVGKSEATPNGDGSGDVNFTITADNALSYKIDFDNSDALNLVYVPTGKVAKKYTKLGINTYIVTAVVYGKGGSSSTVTKEVTVQSNFTPSQNIIDNLTGGASKTWVVDKSLPGHFGVGPWSDNSPTPEWWQASINEKVNCCNCFYTATFTFVKQPGGYKIDVAAPDGAFTKTGALAGGLPGIPGGGDEACYGGYTGGSNSFSFIPSSTGIPGTTPSTKTSILLSGVNTFLGYGALGKEFEILEITPTYMYLRAQGTETGNAWYLKFKSI